MPSLGRTPFTIPLVDGPVRPAWDRFWAGTSVLLVALVVVALAGVTPDARGYNTHTQLGMAPCGWPTAYGMPCPTCGCTTAACMVVHGHWLDAVVTQPFGAVLALLGIALALHAGYCLLQRRSFVDLFVRLPIWWVVVWLLGLALVAWAYKCATFVG